MRKDAIACVALPTCPLALAEGQRYLPTLINKIEKIQDSAGIGDTPISIRMTGCPNGCGRPYLAEIGLIGKAQDKYVLRLGGDSYGESLNQVYLEEADEAEILESLSSLFSEYAKQRQGLESFGDYFNRTAQ
jgi:sulfite reductase (NADPH) hemoprotein beta-component